MAGLLSRGLVGGIGGWAQGAANVFGMQLQADIQAQVQERLTIARQRFEEFLAGIQHGYRMEEAQAEYGMRRDLAAQEALTQPPESRTVRQGAQDVTQEWDPASRAWTEVGRGAHFAPQRPERPTPPAMRTLHQGVETGGSYDIQQQFDPNAPGQWSNLAAKYNEPKGGEAPTTAGREAEELRRRGVPDEVAEAVARHTLRTVWNNATGEVLLINETTGAEFGRLARDPQNTRRYVWQRSGVYNTTPAHRVITSGADDAARNSADRSRYPTPGLLTGKQMEAGRHPRGRGPFQGSSSYPFRGFIEYQGRRLPVYSQDNQNFYTADERGQWFQVHDIRAHDLIR